MVPLAVEHQPLIHSEPAKFLSVRALVWHSSPSWWLVSLTVTWDKPLCSHSQSCFIFNAEWSVCWDTCRMTLSIAAWDKITTVHHSLLCSGQGLHILWSVLGRTTFLHDSLYAITCVYQSRCIQLMESQGSTWQLIEALSNSECRWLHPVACILPFNLCLTATSHSKTLISLIHYEAKQPAATSSAQDTWWLASERGELLIKTWQLHLELYYLRGVLICSNFLIGKRTLKSSQCYQMWASTDIARSIYTRYCHQWSISFFTSEDLLRKIMSLHWSTARSWVRVG